MSKENGPSVYFKQLTLTEKQSKLAQLSRSTENKLLVWIKGESKKSSLSSTQYFRDKNELQVVGKSLEALLEKDLLVSFELSGVHFFGKTKVTTSTGEKFFLDLSGDLFKSERRSNFRLLTYPHQQVYVHIKVPQEKLEESNLINLKSRSSETGLFSNFLSIIGDDENEKKIKGYIRLRVLDVSVTGLALQFSDLEKKFFEVLNIDLNKFYLEFNDEILEIPNGKVLYKSDFLAEDKKTKMYKGGLQFHDVDTNLDEELARIINHTLRSLESEFEDFVK